ncbi:MAG: rane protein [Frankiales bacterium]|nr:rane protein [Frankiales bacterium]
MTTNFLTPANVVERLRDAHLVPSLAARLATPEVANRVGREVTVAVAAAVNALDVDDLTTLTLDLAHRDAARRSYAPLAGRLLADVTAGGAHRPLLDVVLPYLRLSMIDNREMLKQQLKHFGDRYGFLGWLLATDRRAGKVIDKAVAFMAEIEADPQHELRGVLDEWLRKVAYDLQHDPALAARVDAMARQVLADPATEQWLSTVVGGALASLREQLADRDGPLAQRLAGILVRLGQRVVDDEDLQARLEGLLERSVLWAVTEHAAEFTALVRSVIDRWDGAEAARQVELFAGRDLQFIRINGTVVGALAGVVIHAVALALG